MTPIVSSTILRTQSDARLLALVGAGHDRAFEAIVERYRKPIMRYCRRFLPEPRAEDAVQQVFLNAWSALRAGSEVSDLRPWLYRIAHNAALDAVKRVGYDYDELTEALDVTSASSEEVERRWVVRETLTGVAGLPANQREALLRTAVEGQSRAEIARDLQISEGAVRQLVHRARATLRSAATAVTPMPLVSWLAATGPGSGQTPTRIAELAVGGLGAGGGAALAKTGTVVVAAGVLAVGAGTGLEQPSSQAEAEAGGRPPAAQSVRRSGAGITGIASQGATLPSVQRRARAIAPARTENEAATAPRTSNSGPGSINSGPGSVNSGPGSVDSGSGSSGSGRSGSGGDSDDFGDSSGPGSGDEDDHDSSGPGSGDEEEDEDNSGPGSGGDSDGDNSGSGSGSSGSGSDGDGDNSGSGSDSSGSGSGGDSDGDNSGSGNSGSGSGKN
jgi:RNA polymerase sigma factor (sigma-70 family)